MTSFDVTDARARILRLSHVADGGASLMAALVAIVRDGGVPISRCNFTLLTRHPEIVWRTVKWTEAAGVRTIDRSRATLSDPYFTRSPVARLQQGAAPIRVRLEGDGALPYPVCDDLRAEGETDYLAVGLPHTDGETGYVSWATRAPGGFTDEQVAALIALAPELALRVEVASAYHATEALLHVYLGRNAGDRVARGAFQRGGGERIEAAIWFCDLRGFASLCDERSPEEVVSLLDAYFEQVGGAVMAEGGEVLKLIGDALLAIFPVAGDAPAACRRALAAAERALGALAGLNVGRAERGEPTLAMGVGLHLGVVMYGNVGARDRLDFTVISSSVNEAARLESLCKPLATPLVLSDRFAASAGPEGLVDLGLQALKGVRAPMRVFTLARLRGGSDPG